MEIKDQAKQHENPTSLLSHQNPKELTINSPRKQTHNNNTANDRLKRDEWSEGAVSSLLEAYETKWILRNRAKLKGQDWEDVAKHVSERANNSKSAKTQTQCKNKIESMKKRYRSESAAADTSSWPLYPRLDLLLRGNGPPPLPPPPPPPPPVVASAANSLPVGIPELPLLPPPPAMAEVVATPVAHNSHGSNGVDGMVKVNDNNTGAKLPNHEPVNDPVDDTDSSTPTIYTQKEKSNTKPPLKTKTEKKDKAMKRRREEYWEVGESIRWLAEAVVRSEQARMDTMREIERMRVEAEAKRGEMDLKRTEIIANTQLEIARLFAKGSVDSSLKIGRS